MPSEEAVYNALRLIDDPEIGLNLVDLGMIYGVIVEGSRVRIAMTLTTQGCPLHEAMLPAVEQVVGQIDGVEQVDVDLVWEPPWTPERLSPPAAAALGWSEA
jgi:metal-sulfur cluster biosynthetic enzyme